MTTGILILAGVLVAGMLLRMPIGFSMLASGVAYLLVKRQDVGLVAEQVGNGLYNSYVLLAVPLFVFAANIMNAGTVSERIFDFCRILVGRMRGGLRLVQPLQAAVMPLVEPPGFFDRDPEFVEFIEHEPQGAQRALEQRAIGEVE